MLEFYESYNHIINIKHTIFICFSIHIGHTALSCFHLVKDMLLSVIFNGQEYTTVNCFYRIQDTCFSCVFKACNTYYCHLISTHTWHTIVSCFHLKIIRLSFVFGGLIHMVIVFSTHVAHTTVIWLNPHTTISCFHRKRTYDCHLSFEALWKVVLMLYI